MKLIEVLSEHVIQTLKEFSETQQPLTVPSLCEALYGNEAIRSLLSGLTPDSGSRLNAQISAISQDLMKFDSAPNAEPSSEENPRQMLQLRDMLSRILKALGPISREEYIERSSALDKRIRSCQTIHELLVHSDDLITLIEMISSEAIGKIDYTSNFLAGLSKDLTGIEEQLFSYRIQNKDTFSDNNEFHDTLRIHTGEMKHALDKGMDGMLSFISAKLIAIGKAIETKQQRDEIRLEEADSKITQLEDCVRTYNEEIAEVRERANTLEKEVLLDSLMQIPNRRAFELQIREELRRYRHDGQTFSLIFIDVDNFKRINDLFGHRAGDKCLQGMATLISSTLRQSDFVARYGGEELIVILNSIELRVAERVAEKLRLRIEKARFTYQDAEIPVTISIGVTEVLSTDRVPDDPVVRADKAMYEAKKGGRNRVCTG